MHSLVNDEEPFFADLIGSRWLEYGFIATPSPADLRRLFYAYY